MAENFKAEWRRTNMVLPKDQRKKITLQIPVINSQAKTNTNAKETHLGKYTLFLGAFSHANRAREMDQCPDIENEHLRVQLTLGTTKNAKYNQAKCHVSGGYGYLRDSYSVPFNYFLELINDHTFRELLFSSEKIENDIMEWELMKMDEEEKQKADDLATAVKRSAAFPAPARLLSKKQQQQLDPNPPLQGFKRSLSQAFGEEVTSSSTPNGEEENPRKKVITIIKLKNAVVETNEQEEERRQEFIAALRDIKEKEPSLQKRESVEEIIRGIVGTPPTPKSPDQSSESFNNTESLESYVEDDDEELQVDPVLAEANEYILSTGDDIDILSQEIDLDINDEEGDQN
jgi:hypothetical protein